MSTKSSSSSTTVKKSASAKKLATVATPVKETKKASSTKKTVTVAVPEVDPSAEEVPKKERKRREVTKDTVDATFEEVQSRVEGEIAKLRESSEKVRGIKFLRSINKAIKTLHSDTKRVMKLKKKNNRKKTVVSGFLKPIRISAALATFTGWDNGPTDEYSRVKVTKFICDYIKTNHLYNDEDKRLILCDDALKNLLDYDPANPGVDKDGNPAVLNYFRLQRYLKVHFIKIEADKSLDNKTEAKAPKKAASSKKVAAPAKKTSSKSSKVELEEDEDDEEDIED